MPISSFSPGLQKAISFLPGTYGISLVRNHSMNVSFEEMKSAGLPNEFIDGLRDGVDCNLYFFDNKVSVPVMYVVLGATTVALIGVYVALNVIKANKKHR